MFHEMSYRDLLMYFLRNIASMSFWFAFRFLIFHGGWNSLHDRNSAKIDKSSKDLRFLNVDVPSTTRANETPEHASHLFLHSCLIVKNVTG